MKAIYDYIVDYTTQHLYPPSIREICKATGYNSTNTIYLKLRALESLGLIEVVGGAPRCIRLIGYKLVKEAGMDECEGKDAMAGGDS